jgi:murein DD-endopeptidase MepM/ murein hydrolase activator NlpD
MRQLLVKKNSLMLLLALMVSPSLLGFSNSVQLLEDPLVSDTTNQKFEGITNINFHEFGSFCFPIKGKVISPFGNRRRGHRHTGTDIKLKHGDEVRAAFKGIVTKASTYYGYGILVVINHGKGFETYYAHLSKALVHPGDTVSAGTIVGLGGRTGRATTDHLHFEVRENGRPYNAQNYFDFNNMKVLATNIPVHDYERTSRVVHTNEVTKLAVSKDFHQYHKVKKGETLQTIAKRYHVSARKIRILNHLKKRAKLKPGENLIIM